jgi:hypothetical protein
MIFKKGRKTKFTTVDNTAVLDERVSYKAKGILLYLMSRPDDWKIYEDEIAKHSSDGIKSVRSGIKELIKYGYIVRKSIRNEHGRFQGYEYLVFDSPVVPLPSTERPKTENGETDFRERHATNTDTTNKENTNKEGLRQYEIDAVYVNAKDVAASPSFSKYEQINEFYQSYLQILGKHGMRHKRIRRDKVIDVLSGIDCLIENGVEIEEWKEGAEDYLNNLPRGNDGDIQCFLKASPRYFCIQLDEA